jgi:hypothetical protein
LGLKDILAVQETAKVFMSKSAGHPLSPVGSPLHPPGNAAKLRPSWQVHYAFHLVPGKVRAPAGKEGISASFDMKIFAVSWTWDRFPFPESPVFFYGFRGLRGISRLMRILELFIRIKSCLNWIILNSVLHSISKETLYESHFEREVRAGGGFEKYRCA